MRRARARQPGPRGVSGQRVALAAAPCADPDMGNGRYAAVIDYAKWFKLNNAQRAHYNYVEVRSSLPRWRAGTSGSVSEQQLHSVGGPTPSPALQGAPTALVELLLAGLVFPRFAASVGLVYIIGRHFYASGYTKNGPGGRVLGAGLLDVALIGLFGAAVAAGWQIAGAGGALKGLLDAVLPK